MTGRQLFQLFLSDEAFDNEHFHQDIELLYILEGEVEAIVENRESYLRADDILVLNANRKHSFRTLGNVLMLRLMISSQLASKASRTGEAVFSCDSSVADNDRCRELRKILRGMLRHYAENRDYTKSFGYLSDCYAVLEHLTANFMMSSSDAGFGEDEEHYEERLRQINHYINTGYDRQISMKELSEKLFLSNGYLSRFFKKNYGMSFAAYLTNVRVNHAADDLIYTDEAVTRIAYNNGFASAALFNRVFKNSTGFTPTEFRKRNQRTRVKDETAHQEQLEKRVEKMIARDAAEADDDISVPLTVEGDYTAGLYNELTNSWGKLINISDASNLLHSAVREHLIILKQALGFEYVRFWGLFTEEFFIRPEQNDYNFSQIDSVLDFVLEQGLKPHIELGLKPNMIHFGAGSVSYKSKRQMDAYSVEHWSRLIRAFMRHLSNRYGTDAIDSWRMELWFEEDWRRDERYSDLYISLFESTYRAVKACNESILVGGYGIRMDAGFERRRKFLERLNRIETRPDFLSVMYYAYERGSDELDQYARRVTDNDGFLHYVERERKMIAEAGMGDLPLFITEWNLTPSVRNYINDTAFKGAYIIKNIIALYGKADVLGYCAGSDRQYSSFDTGELLFGGTGLVTKDAIMKPAAFAFDFMNRLLPYFIAKTEYYLITTDRHDNYGIVCHNQQQLNYNYYLTPENELDKAALWKYFEEGRKLRIRIRIDGATDGKYRIKVYRVNETSGNVLKIWGDLGYERELSRNDLKYFRRVCEPNLTIRSADARNGELLVEEELAENEIAFISVRYSQ